MGTRGPQPGSGGRPKKPLAEKVLKDSTGQYLWSPSYQAGEPDRLLGYPIYH